MLTSAKAIKAGIIQNENCQQRQCRPRKHFRLNDIWLMVSDNFYKTAHSNVILGYIVRFSKVNRHRDGFLINPLNTRLINEKAYRSK